MLQSFNSLLKYGKSVGVTSDQQGAKDVYNCVSDMLCENTKAKKTWTELCYNTETPRSKSFQEAP